jgi:pimeloyl-ACP methyl ester carboxylesterase
MAHSSPTAPVEIDITDGPTVRGQRSGRESGRWALLFHDEGRDLDAWRGLVRPLVGLGLCVLAVDLPGHGASDDPWQPSRLPANVLGVIRYADAHGARDVCMIGAGASATATLVAAGEHEVAAVVALSPRSELAGFSPDAIRETSAPKLILVGGEDPRAAAEATATLHRTIGWGVMQSFPTTIQGCALLESKWAGQVVETTLAFLRDYV